MSGLYTFCLLTKFFLHSDSAVKNVSRGSKLFHRFRSIQPSKEVRILNFRHLGSLLHDHPGKSVRNLKPSRFVYLPLSVVVYSDRINRFMRTSVSK